MANVVRDPREHPDAIIPDFSKPDPLLTFTLSDVAFVYGSKWKQRYFTKSGRRLLPAAGAVGRHASNCGARTSSQPDTDWWVPHYPADNMQRPTGPLCDGCHSVNYDMHDARGDRVERRLREVPRTRRRSRAAAVRAQHRESGAARLVQRERHLHPVPFAGPAAAESHRGAVLRLAGRLRVGRRASRTSGGSRSTSSARRRSRISPTGRRTRTGCRATTSSQSLMYAPRRHLLQLPRRARHRQQRRSAQAGAASLSGLPRPGSPNGPRARDARAAHAPRAGSAGQRLRRLPHAEDRADDRRRERSQPHLRVHPADLHRAIEGAESVHGLPRR